MKALNLILLAISGALAASAIVSTIGFAVMPYEIASPVTMMASFLIGWNARSVAEKVLGYTLKEALEEKKGE